MEKTILHYVDWYGEERLTRGLPEQVQEKIKMNCKQIIKILTMEEDDMFCHADMKDAELGEKLMDILDLNIAHTRMPN